MIKMQEKVGVAIPDLTCQTYLRFGLTIFSFSCIWIDISDPFNKWVGLGLSPFLLLTC